MHDTKTMPVLGAPDRKSEPGGYYRSRHHYAFAGCADRGTAFALGSFAPGRPECAAFAERDEQHYHGEPAGILF